MTESSIFGKVATLEPANVSKLSETPFCWTFLRAGVERQFGDASKRRVHRESSRT